jgi:hypothetical protein
MATVSFIGLGAVAVLTESPERAVVAGYGARRRGTHFGIYHAAVGVAGLVAGLTFGTIYVAAGGAIALALSAALTLVVVAAGFVTKEVRH